MIAAAALVLDNVGCVRGDRAVFAGVTAELGSGDALVVTGPNGAGKSSVLRLAAGLLRPASGRVERAGRIALADEHHALDPTAPLGRALARWQRLDGGDPTGALAAVGLEALADVPVRLLSTGQRRRAGLARVIAARAAIWLLDEPGNGLDDAARATLERVVATHRSAGGIVVVATHQPLTLPGASAIDLRQHQPALA